MDELVKKKIQFAVSQIDEHIQKSDILLQKCAVTEPDYVELCAIGSIIHAYYNGIENILFLIKKHTDGEVPQSGKWHSELLRSMFETTHHRNAVFPPELTDSLTAYMNFRHFFRHAYGYALEWEKAKPLFLGLQENWLAVKTAIEQFIG